jgi:hypothetical protein
MRIYVNKNKKHLSFLSANPEEQIVSTRSSYQESFMDSMANGNYRYFDKCTSGAKIITKDAVVFPQRTEEQIDGTLYTSQKEIYTYVGEVSNKEEFINLIDNIKVI